MSNTYIIVGLGFGDEGKGTIVDYLTRQHGIRTVVRFNGGAQAAHNVVTPDGKHHTFSQFGSGTLAGASTHLSRFMLVNPFDLLNEVHGLKKLGIQDPLSKISFSPDALVTTPLHIAANQMREELRYQHKHGTCGKGIGETQAAAMALEDAAIRIKDLSRVGTVEAKLQRLSEYYASTLTEDFDKEHGSPSKIAKSYKEFSDKVAIKDDSFIRYLISQGKGMIFEGAQGVLLDQDVGFHPHTTWSKTTSHNARELIGDAGYATMIGVTRAYMTRHGEGPLVHRALAPFSEAQAEPHNNIAGYQGLFRYGAWDALALDYAAKCDPPDFVAVTCLDHLGSDWSSIWSYEYEGDMPDLSPYFWAEGTRIFQVNPGEDRAHVEAITTRLKRCTANMNVHKDVDTDYVIDAIGEVLHAPVTIKSFGPTHKDKKAQVLAWTS